MSDPAAAFAGMSDEEREAALAQLAGLSGLDGRSQLVQEQMARAQALASQPAENNGPGWGGVLNGMAHIFGKIRNYGERQQLGAEQQQLAKQTAAARASGRKLAGQDEPFDLSGYLGAEDEVTAEQRAQALAQGLNRQRKTATALQATGDKTLGGLGQNMMGDLEQRQHQLSEAGMHRLQLAMAAKAAKEKAVGDKAKGQSDIAEGLRKEFLGNQTVKETQSIAAAWAKMDSAFKSGGPAADMSMIYGFMKMQDPTSGVKEGEYATAQNAGSVDQRLIGLYNRLLKGDKLPPPVRADFMNQATEMYSAQMSRFKPFASEYGRLATQAGIQPNDVAIDLGFPNVTPKQQGPTVVESRKTQDGHVIDLYSDGTKKLRK